MMRLILVAALALALIPPAFADGERWEFRISNILSPAEPAARIELWAHVDPADYAFAGAGLDVLASESGWVHGSLLEMGHGLGIGTTPGEIVGSDVLGVIGGQLHIPPHGADPSKPIQVWAADFEVADFTPRSISLATMTSRFEVYPSPVTAASAARLGTLTEGAGELVVIPAPGAALLPFSLAALAAARRRRS